MNQTETKNKQNNSNKNSEFKKAKNNSSNLLKENDSLNNKEENVFYYSDELNDEVLKDDIIPDKIDENYKYTHKNPFWNITADLVYRIAVILTYIYFKIKYKFKYENKKVLRGYKNKGYFVYANHTQEFLDVFGPTYYNFPKRIYVIANPKNVSMKGLKTFVRMMGGLPTPDTLGACKNFFNEIQYSMKKKFAIIVYPEAHVWPYYTKIRNFKSVSFKYPVDLNIPSFCATTTYQRGKNGKCKIITYLDGPFFPDNTLNKKQAQEKLRNEIYEKMCERSKLSNFEKFQYRKIKGNEND